MSFTRNETLGAERIDDSDHDLREYFADCQEGDSDQDSIRSWSEEREQSEDITEKQTHTPTSPSSPPLSPPHAHAGAARTLTQQKRRMVRMDVVPTARNPTEGGSGHMNGDGASLDRHRGADVQKVAAALRSDRLQMPSPVAVEPVSLTTLRRMVLFDFFCALRQSENSTFICASSPSAHVTAPGANRPSWQWRSGIAADVQRSLGFSFYAAMTSALTYANDVAALAAELRHFETVKSFLEAYLQQNSNGAATLAAAFSNEAVACNGTGVGAVRADEALTVASFEALHRLYRWASGICHELGTWVLAVQELGETHAWWCTREGNACALHVHSESSDSNEVAWRHPRRERARSADASWSLSELFRCVEHNLLPLQRCLTILEETRCFRGVAEWVEAHGGAAAAAAAAAEPATASEDDMTFASVCTEHASGIMDFLIIRVSAFQSTSTMDLYRLYMTLLLTCSWPYVRLSTAVLFGFVKGVSPTQWRRQLPRLFRLSFSHIRVSSAMRRQFPTDILSLLLNCLGYEGDDGCADFTQRGGAHQHESDRERKALSALRSSRTFVLRSLCTFASRKSRTRQLDKQKAALVPPKGGAASGSGDATLGPQSSINDILNHLLRGGDNAPMRHLTSFLSEKAQRRWHRAAGLQYTGEEAVTFTTVDAPGAQKVHYPTLVPMGFYTNDEVPPHTSKWGGDDGDDEGEDEDVQADTRDAAHGGGVAAGPTPLQPTIWSLRSMGTKSAAADLQLLNLSEAKRAAADFMEELWINTSVPAARWVTAAILLPVAVVVQRLQSQRLLHLFKIRSAQLAVQSSRLASDVVRSFSFLQAIKLLLDVAFCRDRARIVGQFLEKLHDEPHWWFRRGGGGQDAAPPRKGRLERENAPAGDLLRGARDEFATSSTLISSLFAEAVRGKTFGDMVRLEVLPEGNTSEKIADENLTFAYDMLDVFASFQLHFLLPDEFALILLPKELSMYVRRATESIEPNYSILFWRRRRGPTGQRGDGADSAPHLTVTAADVWSYVFGYLCSLLYAQMVLKNQRKQLHIKDVHDHSLMMLMGKSPQSHSHLGHIARGLGGAYYSLSFVVDTLLSYTYREANTVVYKLERLLKSTPSSSCIVLCEEIDEALLGLQQICFPCRVPSFAGPRERNSFSPSSGIIREHISTVLCLSIDPARLPLKFVTSRASNAIEALVTTITSLKDPDYLKMRLQPLVVSLTFNRYYGAENVVSFRFR